MLVIKNIDKIKHHQIKDNLNDIWTIENVIEQKHNGVDVYEFYVKNLTWDALFVLSRKPNETSDTFSNHYKLELFISRQIQETSYIHLDKLKFLNSVIIEFTEMINSFTDLPF